MQPLLSIITPTYNAQAVLLPTLRSVSEQTWRGRVEHLIIDGASADDTVSVAKTTADVLISEADRGIYDAMNKGLRLATGHYVCFLNAGDTFYAADTLERALSGGAGADFIYGKTLMRRPDDGTVRPWYKTPPPAHELSWRSFINGMVLCHQAMLVRHTCAADFRSDLRVSADLDWCINTLKKVQSIYELPDYMCYYLEGGFSAKNRFRSWTERWRVLQTHFGVFPTLYQHIHIAAAALQRGTWG